MDSKKIEMNSINKLKSVLERSERISTSILDNDRTPTWDGDIFLYNSCKLKKENILGVIRVQVKGKKVGKNQLKRRQINYQIDLSDLRNFRKAGGTIFFVVCMEDYDHYQIYYNSLLPLDLEEILKDISPGQKTKSIELSEFNTDKSMMIFILSYFVKESAKQHSTVTNRHISSEEFDKYDSFSFSTIDSLSNFSEAIFNVPTYIYGRKKGINIEIPLTKMYLESISANNIKHQVNIDGQIYYDYVCIEKFRDNVTIKIGAGFTIYIKSDTNETIINYKEKGSLKERIQDLNFLLGLIDGKTLEIGDILTSKDLNVNQYNIKKIIYELNYYTKIQNLLERLNITKDFNLDLVADEKIGELSTFYEAIMNNMPVHLNDDRTKDKKLFLSTYRIANLNIAILVEKVDNEDYIIKNLFDNHLGKCIVALNNTGMRFPSSIYTKLSKKDFVELSNISFKNMLTSLFSVPYCKQYGATVNQLLLEMISAFDEAKDHGVLKNTIEIAKWLCEQEKDNYLFILNYYQVIRRSRNLESTEKNILHKIKEEQIRSDFNFEILSGVNILLENKADFVYYFEKINIRKKESFVNYPIYTLAKQLKLI